MADGVESGIAVEPDRLDDQRIAFPPADRVPKPGRVGVLGKVAPIEWDDEKPGAQLEQQRDVRLALHDQHRERSVDGPRETIRHAVAGIVAIDRIVVRPVLQAPGCERQVCDPLVIGSGRRHVGNVGFLPDAAQVRFAARQAGNRSCRRRWLAGRAVSWCGLGRGRCRCAGQDANDHDRRQDRDPAHSHGGASSCHHVWDIRARSSRYPSRRHRVVVYTRTRSTRRLRWRTHGGRMPISESIRPSCP